jgi:hypothetical protein
MTRRTNRFTQDGAPSNDVLDLKIANLDEKLEMHARTSKDYAEKASHERAETNRKLDDLLKGINAEREENRKKHDATNKRIDEYELQAAGGKKALGLVLAAWASLVAIMATAATYLAMSGFRVPGK